MKFWQSGSVRGSVALTLLCLAAVIYPLSAGPGPVNTRGGGDSPFLLVRLEQLVAGLRAGAFPVRWMPDAAYGLGYPFFTFYASLPYYLAAGLCFLGWGTVGALQATQALGFILAAAAMTLLARRVFKRLSAVALAIVAYTCAPFHLANVYVRGDSLSEFYAFVFYPLILWSLIRLRERLSPARIAGVGLSIGGLILTHNLSAAIFLPFAAAYALYLLWPSRQGQDRPPRNRRIDWWAVGAMALGGVLALAISATLWLVVLDDLDQVWMGIKDIQTTGLFNYAANFRHLFRTPGASPTTLALVQPSWWFDYDVAEGHSPFAMGAVQAALIGLGVVGSTVTRLRPGPQGDRRLSSFLFWIGGLALSTWLILPASRWLWDRLAVLPIIQFPWRFLSVQALWGALLIGDLAERLPRPWWIASGIALLLVLSAVGGLRPEYLPVGDADITPDRLALFELFTTNIGTTIRGEYLPAAVEPRPLSSAIVLAHGKNPPPMTLEGSVARAALVARDARSQRWQIDVVSDEARLAFYTFYFSGWQARSEDGSAIAIEALPNSGLVALRLPKGEHAVTLRCGRTLAGWIADGLSFAALLVSAGLLGLSYRCTPGMQRRWVGFIAIGVLGIGALVLMGQVALALRPDFASDDLSMDFDRMPFLHHNPDGIRFGDTSLSSYAVDESVHGGELLQVLMRWTRPAPNQRAELWLVSPADSHPDLSPPPPPLAQAAADVATQEMPLSLFVPTDAPSGLYYLALRVYEGERELKGMNARGDTLGTTYLQPVWVDNPRPARSDDAVLARFQDRILLKDDVEVQTDDTGWVVRLTWQAVAPIPANYTCSLHILSASGVSMAQRDFAEGPGYGFWPTTAWPAGEWLTDRLRVPFPEGVRPEDAAALSIVLYDRSQPGFPAAGKTVVPLIEREHRNDVPEMSQRIDAAFGDRLTLLGYDLVQEVGTLRLTLYWQVGQRTSVDGVVFVHLWDPSSGQIVAQSDARPLNGTYPFPWWREGEVVEDVVSVDIRGVPAGSYRLAVGVYDADSQERLPTFTAAGEPIGDRRLILNERIVHR